MLLGTATGVRTRTLRINHPFEGAAYLPLVTKTRHTAGGETPVGRNADG
jgi:hypothetical protein